MINHITGGDQLTQSNLTKRGQKLLHPRISFGNFMQQDRLHSPPEQNNGPERTPLGLHNLSGCFNKLQILDSKSFSLAHSS